MHAFPKKQGLYDPAFEKDSCGVGFVMNMKGEKSHEIITQGLEILKKLEHRGACGSDSASFFPETLRRSGDQVAGGRALCRREYLSSHRL